MPVMLEASAKLKYSEPTTNTKLEPVQVWLQTKVVPVVPELLEAASNAMAISASHHHANDDVGIQNDWQVLVDHHPVRYAGNTCDFIQHTCASKHAGNPSRLPGPRAVPKSERDIGPHRQTQTVGLDGDCEAWVVT